MIDSQRSDLPNEEFNVPPRLVSTPPREDEGLDWSTRRSSPRLPDEKQLLPPPSTASPRLTTSRPRKCSLLSLFLAILGALVLWRTLHEFRFCNSTAARMSTGANQAMGERLGYKQVQRLDQNLVPTKDAIKEKHVHERRLVFVGDVHGMYEELVDLLEKVRFKQKRDHLVLTGDLVLKGPHSLKVIDLARELSASCVRGNQDDRVLLYYQDLQRHKEIGNSNTLDARETSKGRGKEARELAAALNKEQADWLDNCPLILTAEKVHHLGNIAVVHGGLVQGVKLERQDPVAVMNMRSITEDIRVPSHSDKGMHWAKLWNKEEKKQKHPVTVIYGHYAARGLDIRPLTKGLDSDCARGGQLTALVVSNKQPKEEIVSVNCRKMAD